MQSPPLPAGTLRPFLTDARLAAELAFINAFQLAAHDVRVAQLLHALASVRNPGTYERLCRVLCEVLVPYHAWHEDGLPFPVAPPGPIEDGALVLGHQVNGRAVRIRLDEHLLLVGPTGVGKSTLLRHLLDQVDDKRRVTTVDVDIKGDRGARLQHPHVHNLGALAFSPIALPPGLPIAAAAHIVTYVFQEAFYVLQVQQNVVAPALEALWRRTLTPSLAMWQEEIRRTKSEEARKAANRLESVRLAHPGHFTSTTNLWQDLTDQSLYLGLQGPLLPGTRFLLWLVLYVRWCLLRARGNRTPHTITVLDEGDTSFHARTIDTSPTGAPSIAVQALLRMREAGITFWVGSPTWDLDPAALANFPNQVFLRSTGRESLRIAQDFHWTTPQLDALRALPVGTGIAVARRADHPFLFTFPDDPREKTPPPLTLSDDQPPEPPPAPAPPVPALPALRESPLVAHAATLARDVAEHPYTLCTPAYHRCQLLLAQGDRARAQLERLGFLRAVRVTCGRGRGKTGIALLLTPTGWASLGRTPPKGLRGGSGDQHSFCVWALHRRIPCSLIEERVGTKSVDLLIPFDTTQHEPLYRALSALTGKTPYLQDGDLLALEVEISEPARSARRNATKNAVSGVALTILAIADRTPEHLGLLLPPNAVVVDVFALLDSLRKEHPDA